jgi:hypothetical protein
VDAPISPMANKAEGKNVMMISPYFNFKHWGKYLH